MAIFVVVFLYFIYNATTLQCPWMTLLCAQSTKQRKIIPKYRAAEPREKKHKNTANKICEHNTQPASQWAEQKQNRRKKKIKRSVVSIEQTNGVLLSGILNTGHWCKSHLYGGRLSDLYGRTAKKITKQQYSSGGWQYYKINKWYKNK